MLAIPANQLCLSRYRHTVESDAVQRQGQQIVQSCMTLEDFLPGFGHQAIRLVGTEFDGNSGDRIRQILDLDPEESIWAITREPLDPDIAAGLDPRCEVYDGATAEEYADFMQCRDEAMGDGNCNARTVFVLELNEDGETFDIVGIQVICQGDPKF